MAAWTAKSYIGGDITVEIEGIGGCAKFTLNGMDELVVAAARAYVELTRKGFELEPGKTLHDYFVLTDIDYRQQIATFRRTF